MQAVGNGWYRLTLTATLTSAGSANVLLYLNNADSASAITYAGTGTGSYIYGAQLEAGATASSYIPTTTAAATRSADVAQITGTNFGRTNYIRNNTMVGAVAGTPGTAPTNWFGNATVAGITRQIVGTGVEDGINYIDYRIAGTTTAALFFGIGPELSTVVAATNGQTWTFSSYARLIAGSLAGFTQLNFYVVFNNSSGTGVQFVTGGITPTSAALGTQRFTRVATASNATTAFVQPTFQFEAPTGTSVDVTLRIGLPQLELGSTATAVIPTNNTANTGFVSSWYRQDEGTVFSAFSIPTSTTIGGARVYSISNNGATTQAWLRLQGGTNRVYEVTDSSTQQAVLSAGAFSAGVLYRGAVALKTNDFGFSENGSTPTVDNSGTLGTVDRMGIGMDPSGAAPLNGHIRRITYWPQALPGRLQAITQP
jgi:hypothetical protein